MEDFDRDSNASSDEQEDELMHDAEDHEENNQQDEQEQEQDDDENENENDDDDDEDHDNDDEDDNETQDPGQNRGRGSHHGGSRSPQPDGGLSQPTIKRTSATPGPLATPKWAPAVRPEYLSAHTYDIVPTMAAPMATSINALSVTPDLRYWITGGTDGYIRKYDGPGTINGKQQLTVAQKHPFVDTVTKAGILMSYWENAEPPHSTSNRTEDLVLSPVYSLAVHSEALWLLSGLESGGINLQSVRHDEGKRITCLRKHTSAVSVLTLAADEQSVLSGSWDRSILDWDLNTGDVKRSFDGSGGQISAIETRPSGGMPIPPEAAEEDTSDTLFHNNDAAIKGDDFDFSIDGVNGDVTGDAAGVLDGDFNVDQGGVSGDMNEGGMDAQGSPAHDSLFGGSPTAGSDLFGDNFGGDDDNEFSRAMLQDSAQEHMENNINNDMAGTNLNASMDGTADITSNAMDENHLGVGDPNNLGDPGLDAVPPDASMPDFDLHLPSFDGMAEDGNDGALANPDPTQAGDTDTAGASFDSTFNPELSTQPTTDMATHPLPTQDDLFPQSPSALFEPTAPESPSAIFAEAPATHFDPSQTSGSTFLSAAIDGPLRIWDRRMQGPAARIGNRTGVPPWCMGACWSNDGDWIYVGRRNGTVEEFSMAKARGGSGGWQPERVFKFPLGSGPVSCLRPMANGRHLICASHDILRLYDLHAQENSTKRSPPPFLIVPGPPRAGVISSLYIDQTSRFMLSTAGTRGWEGTSTEALVGYEINVPTTR